MRRPFVLAIAASAAIFVTTAAQATPVSWSVGISVPPVGAVIAPTYPGYADHAGYAPAPRLIVEPAPYYAPRPRVWLPPLPVWTGNERWRDGWREGWHDRREDLRNDRHDGRDGRDRRDDHGHDDGRGHDGRGHDGRDHDGHFGRVGWR